MAQLVLTNAKVEINTVDLSDHVKSVTVNLVKDDHDDTAMGDSAHSHLAGLQNNEVTITFQQDFASSKVDATVWGMWNAGTASAVHITPVNTTIAATNPEYQLSAVCFEYHPIDGAAGEEALTSVTFRATTVATRNTTPD